MKIVVIGAGGVGGYFGARLARAGHAVHFVARGAHGAVIREHGLRVIGPTEDFTVTDVDAPESVTTIGPADVVLFCVKCHDTDDAARGAQALLHEDTLWLTLQNGIDSAERLARFVAPRHIVAGAAFVSAVIAEPGVVRFTSRMSSLVFGQPHGSNADSKTRDGRCEAFAVACRQAGFDATVAADIDKALWSKFAALATNAALTGVVRQPAGIVYGRPELRALAQRSIAEVIAVARARGIALDADLAETSLALLDSFPPGMYASLYHDLVLGKPIEIGYLSGRICALDREHGVATPFHDFAYACLAPYENGPPAQA